MNKNYANRKIMILTLFILIGILFIARLFHLQILNNEYKLSAQNNVLREITRYPARGLIYDRNGELLVYNEAVYDLLVTPNQVHTIDTLGLCRLLKIDIETYIKLFNKAKRYSNLKPSTFLKQISKEDYGYLSEQLYKFPGFFVQARTLRKYPSMIAAHVLGYVGEVDQNEITNDQFYSAGDYIGKNGIEKFYETLLRGNKGIEIKLVDVFNREMGSYQDGEYDLLAMAGKDLQISIDAKLQAYGELLMRNKKGSIVAIEPSTGEILSLISSPAYDPNLLIGRIRSENFLKLSVDTLEPLFNRATMAQYPPGSTFKLVTALAALNEELLNQDTRYECRGIISTPLVCSHNHESPLNLVHAIEQSCNPYFYKVFRSILEQKKFASVQKGYDLWRDYIQKFGIGQKLHTDIIGQRNGNLPASLYFNEYYGQKGWKATTVRSLSIGQGEVELTPLQMANQVAIIANRGFSYPPHLIKSTSDNEATEFSKATQTGILAEHFETIIEGMSLVYSGGNSAVRNYRIDSIQMCGKTGTSENPFG
ncbi:MAG: hypothetical protein GY834_08810, partial [Bacteroidetes bacterium]|nr:hypothetical protein [Bacteroidota bacterium]